jgi:N-methylhydantoinase A
MAAGARGVSTNSDDDRLCMGVDVGGTFTDAVLTRGTRTWRAKAPTTPADLAVGVLDACRRVSSRAGSTFEALLPLVARFGLGTTAVTNTLASRQGRRVGLLTTRGFEELVPLARGRRVNEDGWLMMPAEILDRGCIAGIDERIDRDGNVIIPIDPSEAASAAKRLVEERAVEALAVSFLWSFRNPAHEQQALAAINAAMPEIVVTCGSELHPVMREYERTTFALLNAYTARSFEGIDRLATELNRLGLTVPLLLVHSAGGSLTVDEARRVPMSLAESGPAAGVAAAALIAQHRALDAVVTCDMGGTSFDVSMIEHGEVVRRHRGDLMGVWTAMPLVDVESIGAGGGSVAWIDALGILRVGPQSAGADPGPACYGRGGSQPTVTDALVVLGYLAPDGFLGGEMALDAQKARAACAELGAQLGMDALEVAWGIREIALVGMVKAVRVRIGRRGLDPRRQSLISFGGCGGLFAPAIADHIGARTVLVPELASVLSAFGAATADVRRERTQSLGVTLPAAVGLVEGVADALRAEVDAQVASDGVAASDRAVRYEADMRFRRQVWELTVPLGERVDGAALSRLVGDFRTEYAQRYGEGALMMGAPVELASLRAVGTGRTVQARLAVEKIDAAVAGTAAPACGARAVHVARGAPAESVPVHAGSDLRPGHAIAGPALIDGSDTTTWVPHGHTAVVDDARTIILEQR